MNLFLISGDQSVYTEVLLSVYKLLVQCVLRPAKLAFNITVNSDNKIVLQGLEFILLSSLLVTSPANNNYGSCLPHLWV